MSFFKGILWNSLESMVPQLLSFLSVVIIGRYLTISEFGIYSFIRRVIASISPPIIQIAGFSYNYYFQKKKEKSKIFYTIGFILFLITVIIIVLLFAFLKHLIPIDVKNTRLFYIGLGLLLFTVVIEFHFTAFNALFKFKLKVLLRLIRAFAILISLGILILVKRLSLINIFLVLYLSYLMIIIIGEISINKVLNSHFNISLSQTLRILESVLEKTKYFIAATFMNSAVNFILFLFLAKLTGSYKIGIFSYSLYFALIITIIGGSISKTLLPFTSKEGEKMTSYLWLSNYGLLYFSVPLVIFSILVYNPFLKIVFKKSIESGEGIFVFSFLLVYLVLKTLSGNLGVFLNGLGKTRDTLKISTITLMIFMVLGFILIKKYSLLGCAIALFLTYLIQLLLALWYVKKNNVKHMFYSPNLIAKVLFTRLTKIKHHG